MLKSIIPKRADNSNCHLKAQQNTPPWQENCPEILLVRAVVRLTVPKGSRHLIDELAMRQAALAAQEAMSHSSRSPTRRRSKPLAKHPQPWQGMTRRSGHAASWEDEDVVSESGKGAQGGAREARHPQHVVQEPNAMYTRTQLFKQKVAQRWGISSSILVTLSTIHLTVMCTGKVWMSGLAKIPTG